MTVLTVALSGGERIVEAATVDEVVAAIHVLAGDGEVWLGDPLRQGLGIAGGPDRYFVAYSDHDDGIVLQARATDPVGEALEAVIGGQLTSLPGQFLVASGVAVEAAKYFMETAQPAPSVAWEEM